MRQGADVRGYYPWSFIDLLSGLNGYKKQYGFVYVDRVFSCCSGFFLQIKFNITATTSSLY